MNLTHRVSVKVAFGIGLLLLVVLGAGASFSIFFSMANTFGGLKAVPRAWLSR